MTAPPRVAVVIPTFDDGTLVLDAVASVREGEPVEIVVVDDGSTDPASQDALAELRAGGVRVERQENAGPSAARNRGIASTSARHVLALDADDLLEPGALGELADALDADPGASFAWGDYEEFGEREGRYGAPREMLPWTLTYVNLFFPSLLFRRAALDGVGGWPSTGYEDWALMLRFVEAGARGVYVDRVVYRRRMKIGGQLAADRRQHVRLWRELRRTAPGAFARRSEWRRLERPAMWKRLAYPLVFGPRLLLPPRAEHALRQSRAWAMLRPLRR